MLLKNSFFCILLSFSCHQQNDIITFTIPKGEHYSTSKRYNTILSRLTKKDRIDFQVLFTESCRYDLGNANQLDINKLIGFTDCSKLPHTQSARIGWRYLNDSIHLFGYCYVAGIRKYEYINSYSIGEWIDCSLVKLADGYYFRTNDNGYIEYFPTCEKGINGVLLPYFGGDEVAPHEVRILVKLP